MTGAALYQIDPLGLSATVEVRYKCLRPLPLEHAIIAVQRSLVRAIQAGLVMHSGPAGSKFVTKLYCGLHADKENTVVCLLYMTFDSATAQDYTRYREELRANLAAYLDNGTLNFSIFDHEVERVVTNVYHLSEDVAAAGTVNLM